MADDKVGGAKFELGVDHGDFVRQLAAAEKAAKQSADALQKIAEIEAKKAAAAQEAAAKRAGDAVSREAKRKATAEAKAADTAAKEAKRAADAQAKEADKAAKAVEAAMAKQAKAAKKAADDIEDRFDRIAGMAARTGLALTAGLTAPIGLGVGGVGALGTGFESSLQQSIAIMGDLSDAMKKDMGQTALEVSKQTTFAAEQTAAGFYFLASAGYDAMQSMKALPQVAMFAQAGMMDLAQATEFAADMQAALGLKSKDAEQNLANLTRVTDVVTMAANKSNASISQFAEAISNKTGAALRLVGKDIEEGAAVLSVYADQGRKGALAGEMLNSALMRLLPIAQQNKAEFEKLGVHVFEKGTGNLRHFADIADDFTKLLQNLSPEMQAVALEQMGINIEVAQGILPLIGMGDAIREYEKAYRSAGGATRDVAEKQLQTARAQWQLFKNDVAASAIMLYQEFEPAVKDSLIPVLQSAAGALQGIVKWFRGLSEPAQTVIVAFVGIAAAAGPIMGVAAGAAIALKALAVAFGVTMGAAAAMAATVAVAFAAIAAIILSATILYTTFERDIKRILRAAGQSFVDFGDSIMWAYNNYVVPAVQSMIDYTVDGLNALIESTGEFGDKFVALFAAAWEAVAGIFDRGAKMLGNFFGKVTGFFSPIKGYLKSMGSGAEAAMQLMSGDWQAFNGGVPTMKMKGQVKGDNLGDDLNYTSLRERFQKIKAELEKPENQPKITPQLDLGGGDGKEGADMRKRAEEFRKSLFPAEALEADIREVMEMASKFPDVIDAAAQAEAFEKMWADYKDKGIVSMEAIANGMADLSDTTKARFAAAMEEARTVAHELEENAKRRKEEEQAERDREAKRKSDKELLHGMTLDADPQQALMEQLNEVQSAMQNLGQAMPQDVLDFFVGNKIEGLRMTTAQLHEMRDIAVALGPEFQKAFDKAIGKTAAKEQADRWKRVSGEMEKYAEGLSYLPDEYQNLKTAATIAMKVIQIATAATKATTGDWFALIMMAADAFGLFGEKAEKEISGVDKAMKELGDALESWGDQFTDMLVEFARTGKLAFKDLVDTILSDILRVTIQLTITEPIINAIKGMFADGGAFGHGIQYMAKGDIVSSPTLFGMAGGKLGMMGEKGPEAVMPLARTSDGRLGVQAMGGGSNQQVNIFPAPGQPAPEVTRGTGPDGTEIVNVVFGAVRTLADTGRLDSVQARNYGTRRPGRPI